MVPVPGRAGAMKTIASIRAQRRAYDGAPPVIPHEDFSVQCMNCHTQEGLSLPDVGFAPPMPHERTKGLSAFSRCRQCHVFKNTDGVFVASTFEGLPQDLRHGDRLHPLAPPVMPHRVFMRENCWACHTGPAAREEIRCSHPERPRCLQCHLPRTTTDEFAR
jgi:cytochrome c-type protein NapB